MIEESYIIFNGTRAEFAEALKYAISNHLGSCFVPSRLDPVPDDALYDSYNEERNQKFIAHARKEREENHGFLDDRCAAIIAELRRAGK